VFIQVISGFVQVMRGKITDAEKLAARREKMGEFEKVMQGARPEVIGEYYDLTAPDMKQSTSTSTAYRFPTSQSGCRAPSRWWVGRSWSLASSRGWLPRCSR